MISQRSDTALQVSITTLLIKIWNLIESVPSWPILLALVVALFLLWITVTRIVPWSKKGIKNLVFISYRHSVDDFSATSITERLTKKFGENAVFLDDATIEGGDKWEDSIDQALEKCGAFLPVIVKGWLDKIRELDGVKAKDWVRYEIAAVLMRSIRPIPVLVNDASMPKTDELPDDIKSLAIRQPARVRKSEFKRDCDHLAHLIVRSLSIRKRIRVWTKSHAPRAAYAGMVTVIIVGIVIDWIYSALSVISR